MGPVQPQRVTGLYRRHLLAGPIAQVLDRERHLATGRHVARRRHRDGMLAHAERRTAGFQPGELPRLEVKADVAHWLEHQRASVASLDPVLDDLPLFVPVADRRPDLVPQDQGRHDGRVQQPHGLQDRSAAIAADDENVVQRGDHHKEREQAVRDVPRLITDPQPLAGHRQANQQDQYVQ